MAFDQKAANLWVARFIPLILIGIVGYVTWVVVALVCVDYLLKPPATLHKPRPGTAIAILIIYFTLLLFVASTYCRILQTVLTNPGYVARGPRWYAEREAQAKARKTHPRKGTRREDDAAEEKSGGTWSKHAREDGYPSNHAYTNGLNIAGRPSTEHPAPGLEAFYCRNVFVCEGDGRPIWCSTCLTWKPDRAHHCREVGRCVRKMDHFCPWVGGIVSETNFKFFVQFVTWSAIFCMFVLIFMAIFVSEMRKETDRLDVHMILTLAFAALFGLFTIGMAGSSIQFLLLNTTTVDNLSRKVKVYTLAVYLPRPPNPGIAVPFQTITYPLTQPSADGGTPPSTTPPRTFAILHTKPGASPWDLGPLRNFKSVMGEHWYDWILPLKYSPSCNHDRGDSAFELGPVVQRMREDAGIAEPHEGQTKRVVDRRKRRRLKRDSEDDTRLSKSDRGRRKKKRRRHQEEAGAEAGEDPQRDRGRADTDPGGDIVR